MINQPLGRLLPDLPLVKMNVIFINIGQKHDLAIGQYAFLLISYIDIKIAKPLIFHGALGNAGADISETHDS